MAFLTQLPPRCTHQLPAHRLARQGAARHRARAVWWATATRAGFCRLPARCCRPHKGGAAYSSLARISSLRARRAWRSCCSSAAILHGAPATARRWLAAHACVYVLVCVCVCGVLPHVRARASACACASQCELCMKCPHRHCRALQLLPSCCWRRGRKVELVAASEPQKLKQHRLHGLRRCGPVELARELQAWPGWCPLHQRGHVRDFQRGGGAPAARRCTVAIAVVCMCMCVCACVRACT